MNEYVELPMQFEVTDFSLQTQNHLHCSQQHQTISYCGVNAHFQNGIAERAIRDITDTTRTMLLHAKARWPSAVHLCLWPYAVRMAVYIYNTAPVLLDGKSRIELFSGVNVGFCMKDNHVFGCPVFALQNDLAAGNTVPKWSPRSRLGLNLGPSPSHARTVNMVLNLFSGLVSPQFHCCYDDFFETTQHSHQDVITQANWKQLAGFVKYDGTPIVQDRLSRPAQIATPIGTSSAPLTLNPVQFSQDTSSEDDSDSANTLPDFMQDSEGAHDESTNESETTLPTAGISSRGQTRKLSHAMQDSISQHDFYGIPGMHYMGNRAITTAQQDAEIECFHEHDFHLELQERMRHPIAFHAEMMGDIMYFHQALQQPDAAEFVKALIKEVNGHIENKRWKLVKRSEVPKDVDIIPSVWSMRRKRNLTTNEITKYKSRLNLHGGKQVYGMN